MPPDWNRGAHPDDETTRESWAGAFLVSQKCSGHHSMVQSELPISVLFMTGIGSHLLFYNQRRERFDTASNPCARGLLERGAIKLIAQLVPSMGRTPDLFRRCQMTQRLDYNAASPAGVKALGSVYGHIMQNGHPKALVDMPNARHLPGRRP